MKRPAELVQSIIEESDFPYTDIYENSIPNEELDAADKTQILLREAVDNPSGYGNSTFVRFQYAVYIQIFYAVEADFNAKQAEMLLMKDFISNNWQIAQSQPRYEDPDTGQIIKNIIVQRTMTLSEMADS